MPRKKRSFSEPPRRISGDLIARLVDELKSDRQSGQPTIYEEEFPNGKLRVVVTWDDWDRMPMEERTALILGAYREAFGANTREKIALASGLTIPEAAAAGMLPVQIIPAIRQDDPVTPEECRQAMIDEGASILLGADRPLLRFQTVEDADAARLRLIEKLPNSTAVWVVTENLGELEPWVHADTA